MDRTRSLPTRTLCSLAHTLRHHLTRDRWSRVSTWFETPIVTGLLGTLLVVGATVLPRDTDRPGPGDFLNTDPIAPRTPAPNRLPAALVLRDNAGTRVIGLWDKDAVREAKWSDRDSEANLGVIRLAVRITHVPATARTISRRSVEVIAPSAWDDGTRRDAELAFSELLANRPERYWRRLGVRLLEHRAVASSGTLRVVDFRWRTGMALIEAIRPGLLAAVSAAMLISLCWFSRGLIVMAVSLCDPRPKREAQRERRLRSLACPHCAYSLVGLSTFQCPECGEAWTADELGAARELRPDEA